MAASYPIPEGSLVTLWSGENPDFHTSLLEQLESAGIPFVDKSLGDDDSGLTADPLPIGWKPRFGFEVAVMSTDLPAAQAILDKLLEQEAPESEIPANDQPTFEEPPPVSTAHLALTAEVWSGTDARIAQFLVASMEENDIPAHLEDALDLKKIFVAPANEKRAREIVNEVISGTPPE